MRLMAPGNAAFDLARTFILINDGPTAMPIAVGPDFWQSLQHSPIANSPAGRLISLGEQTADWKHWEMHPAGDEILILLSGSLELILEEDSRERVVGLEPLEALIVPRGTWHRARVRVPGKLLGITAGAGTQHRPIAQP
jgi:mannose-6-phosphate isomerase-like protein (cupin superfamily)